MLKNWGGFFKDFTANQSRLMEIDGFPYDMWSELQSIYEDAENWISGEELENLVSDGGEQADLYPMRVNPLPSAVEKHVATLFGEYEDDGRTPVYPKLVLGNMADEKEVEEQAKRAEEIEEILNTIWMESMGRSLMLKNGFTSQIYGGFVFKLTYVPWETWPAYNRTYPFRIEAPHPKEFVGFPSANDDFLLSEAWIVREWSAQQAAEFGYTGNESTVFGVEKWTPKEYSFTIDGKVAVKNGNPLQGENKWGFVPIVYIPHRRYLGFYGTNIIEPVKHVLKELNRTWGDVGDAVVDDAHKVIAIRNTSNVQPRKITPWLTVIDLGSTTGLSTDEGKPDMFQVNRPAASQPMMDSVGEIYKQYRRDVFIPPVADGEDEGSQRSGVTLDIRFWPLTSHTKMERIDWTSGLNLFDSMILRALSMLTSAPITKEESGWRMKQKWAPQLPRDRSGLIDEVTKRASSDLASPETLMEVSGDIEDIQSEKRRILDWKKQNKRIEIDAELALQKLKNDGAIEAADKQAEAFQNRQASQGPKSGGKNNDS